VGLPGKSYLQFWQIISFRFNAPSSWSGPSASGLVLVSFAARDLIGGVTCCGASSSSTALKPS